MTDTSDLLRRIQGATDDFDRIAKRAREAREMCELSDIQSMALVAARDLRQFLLAQSTVTADNPHMDGE